MKAQFESGIKSIEVYDKMRCYYVNYRKRKKNLFGLLKPSPGGYYTDSGHYLGDEEDLLNGAYKCKGYDDEADTIFYLICENKKAYYKPYVSIVFESGKSKNAKFNTLEECNEYAKKLGNEFNLLDVTFNL